MEASGQLHATDALPPVPTEYNAEQAPHLVNKICKIHVCTQTRHITKVFKNTFINNTTTEKIFSGKIQ
jgi:hypothetical protein